MFLCEFLEVGYSSLKLIFPQKNLYHVIILHVVKIALYMLMVKPLHKWH